MCVYVSMCVRVHVRTAIREYVGVLNPQAGEGERRAVVGTGRVNPVTILKAVLEYTAIQSRTNLISLAYL